MKIALFHATELIGGDIVREVRFLFCEIYKFFGRYLLSAVKSKYLGGLIGSFYKANNIKGFVINKEFLLIVKIVFKMFFAWSNYVDLIRYLNGRDVKTIKWGSLIKTALH